MGYGPTSSTTGALAADARSLNNLKLQAGQKTPAAIQEAAKQFESLFMRELIKSMRDATMKSGMNDSPGSDLGTDLLDQQYAVQMSGKPGGLSDLIAAQLTRQMGGDEADATDAFKKSAASVSTTSLNAKGKASALAAYGANTAAPKNTPTLSQSNFVQRYTAAAIKVEKATGIPASFMVGQAGHETGWGNHEIKMKGGVSSNNLFGIKAGAGWTGKVAEVTTTEFVNGTAVKKMAKFRAYDTPEDSFRDYARLITKTPRYAQASQQTDSVQAFASSLQKAGYATDPDYAAKLGRAINITQRLQRAQVVAQSV